tara:strand:- start:68 stop:376 length:309 start_codon:yes stop_codon:yes gene_type:complete
MADELPDIDWGLPDPEILKKLDELNGWRNQRIDKYAMLNQYEMIFDDIKAGKLGEEGEWYKAIVKIKSEIPKPSNIPELEKEVEEMITAEREAKLKAHKGDS